MLPLSTVLCNGPAAALSYPFRSRVLCFLQRPPRAIDVAHHLITGSQVTNRTHATVEARPPLRTRLDQLSAFKPSRPHHRSVSRRLRVKATPGSWLMRVIRTAQSGGTSITRSCRHWLFPASVSMRMVGLPPVAQCAAQRCTSTAVEPTSLETALSSQARAK